MIKIYKFTLSSSLIVVLSGDRSIMSTLDALSEIFSNIMLRSRIVLNGAVVFSRRLASPMNINDLAKELDEDLHYLSIEVMNSESITYHLYVYKNKPIACIKEFSADIMGEKCLQELSQLLGGNDVKVKIIAFKAPADVVKELGDKLSKEVKPVSKAEKIEKQATPSVSKEKPPVEKLEPTIEREKSRSVSSTTSITAKVTEKKPTIRAEEKAGFSLDVPFLSINEEDRKLDYFVPHYVQSSIIFNHIKPVITLLLLSPVVAELVSGATTFLEFINPHVLFPLVRLYGVGALLIREIKVRYDLSYGSVLLLGFAYGVIEEGIVAKSFFESRWEDLGIFGEYEGLFGVNWVWLFYLTLYHGVWSILAPIAIVEAVFEKEQRIPWLGRKGFVLALLVFIVDVLVINRSLSRYNPGIVECLGCIVVILVLGLLALWARSEVEVAIAAPRNYLLYWFIWGVFFFVFFYTVPYCIAQPLAPIILWITLAVTAYILSKTIDAGEPMHAYALFTGITFVLLELNLMKIVEHGDLERLAVSLAWIIFLVLLYIKIKGSS